MDTGLDGFAHPLPTHLSTDSVKKPTIDTVDGQPIRRSRDSRRPLVGFVLAFDCTAVETTQKNGNPGKPASAVGSRRLRMEIPQSYPLFLCTTVGHFHAAFVTKIHVDGPSVGHAIPPGQILGNVLQNRVNTGSSGLSPSEFTYLSTDSVKKRTSPGR